MVAPSIIDPFFRKLYSALAEEIDNRVNVLARGGALVSTNASGIGFDPVASAMKYQEQVAYIAALQATIELGVGLDRDTYSNKTNNNGDD